MKTVNKKRAELLTPIFGRPQNEQEEEEQMIDCQLTVNSLAGQMLKETFSHREERRCNQCTFADFRNSPTLMANRLLLPDFSNLSDAVLENFGNSVCSMCQNALTVDSEFGQLLFLEVNIGYVFLQKTIDWRLKPNI